MALTVGTTANIGRTPIYRPITYSTAPTTQGGSATLTPQTATAQQLTTTGLSQPAQYQGPTDAQIMQNAALGLGVGALQDVGRGDIYGLTGKAGALLAAPSLYGTPISPNVAASGIEAAGQYLFGDKAKAAKAAESAAWGLGGNLATQGLVEAGVPGELAGPIVGAGISGFQSANQFTDLNPNLTMFGAPVTDMGASAAGWTGAGRSALSSGLSALGTATLGPAFGVARLIGGALGVDPLGAIVNKVMSTPTQAGMDSIKEQLLNNSAAMDMAKIAGYGDTDAGIQWMLDRISIGGGGEILNDINAMQNSGVPDAYYSNYDYGSAQDYGYTGGAEIYDPFGGLDADPYYGDQGYVYDPFNSGFSASGPMDMTIDTTGQYDYGYNPYPSNPAYDYLNDYQAVDPNPMYGTVPSYQYVYTAPDPVDTYDYSAQYITPINYNFDTTPSYYGSSTTGLYDPTWSFFKEGGLASLKGRK